MLMPTVGEMGMPEKRIEGAYMNSKHWVREKITVWINYYMENQWSGF